MSSSVVCSVASRVLPLRCHQLHTRWPYITEPTYSTLLDSCPDYRTLKEIHGHIVCSGFHRLNFNFVASKLIARYTDFGDLESSLWVFNGLSESAISDTSLWNLIIKAHVDANEFDSALALYRRMREASASPDRFTIPLVNRVISSLPNRIQDGKCIHSLAIRMGYESNIYVGNTLIEMYGKHGLVVDAQKVLDNMLETDVVSWSSLISCNTRAGNTTISFNLFNEMRLAGLEPNSVMLVILLQACSVAEHIDQGMQFHGYVIKKGFETHKSLQNTILLVYSKHGCLQEAESFFRKIEKRDVVAWNIMILGYSMKEDSLRVAESFNQMRMEVHPCLETLTLVISALAKSGNLLQGMGIHSYAVKAGLNDTILQTSLVDFYAKSGELDMSAQLFEELPKKNIVSWSIMISGFAHNGYFTEAIQLFRRMLQANLKSLSETVSSIMHVYTQLGALRLGKGLHGYVIRNILLQEGDTMSIETAIINMYAKCGDITSARRSFDRLKVKDVIAWSSMIEAYGAHGFGLEAVANFNRMQEEGAQPNSITFLNLLSACNHSGLVHQGCRIFSLMSEKYGITPNLNHYTCLVDLLARAGRLEEAQSLISNMELEPDSRIWGALLASSRTHLNCELGEYAAQRVFDLEPDNVGYHVVLSNIRAGFARWREVKDARNLMNKKELKKKPAWSCLEVAGQLHGFVAGDRSHIQISEIYKTLQCLAKITEEVV